jgi:signal transduction histidine kinase
MAALLAQPPQRNEDGLSTIAERLRSPVARLRANAERLDEAAADQSGSDAARELAGRIVEQAELMAGWVGAILEIERMRLGKLPFDRAQLDLAEVARGAIEAFRAKTRHVRIRLVSSEAALVCADRKRLTQVIVCMLDNTAARARGRDIEVEVRLSQGRWRNEALGGMLVVRDATRNLDEEELRRCWQQAAPLDLDLDADLFLALEICRLHGGNLWADANLAALVLPTQFSPVSHTILASNAPYLPLA